MTGLSGCCAQRQNKFSENCVLGQTESASDRPAPRFAPASPLGDCVRLVELLIGPRLNDEFVRVVLERPTIKASTYLNRVEASLG